MASYGTTQKCRACDKTVHFVEMISADGIPYHQTCFKCTHCNGRLAISNYSAVDGQLYCKPHFEQLFKETGNFTSKKSQSAKGELNKTPSKVSSFFSGTQEKCAVCTKTVYPLEKVSVEGEFYHKQCFKCAHGGCLITPSSYAALDGILYCKPHFAQLFKEKGSYTHLTQTTHSRRNSMDATTPVDAEHEPEAHADADAEAEAEAKPEHEPEPEPEHEPEHADDSKDEPT